MYAKLIPNQWKYPHRIRNWTYVWENNSYFNLSFTQMRDYRKAKVEIMGRVAGILPICGHEILFILMNEFSHVCIYIFCTYSRLIFTNLWFDNILCIHHILSKKILQLFTTCMSQSVKKIFMRFYLGLE